ncbi:MAG: hypothetical protein WBG14_09340, partial [Rhodococcus sp. (in: high G+C Gram-positive bacteria)]
RNAGQVGISVRALESEPSQLHSGDWDTIEEISFRALSAFTRVASGEYYPFASEGAGLFQSSVTPSGPGFYRVRAYERNRRLAVGEHRDANDPPTQEIYVIEVWPTNTEDEDRRRLKGPQSTMLR